GESSMGREKQGGEGKLQCGVARAAVEVADSNLIVGAADGETLAADPDTVEVLHGNGVASRGAESPEQAYAVTGVLVGFVQELVEVVEQRPGAVLLHDRPIPDDKAQALINRRIVLVRIERAERLMARESEKL